MSTPPPTSTWRAPIVVNAKMRRTGICGAAETLLVDRAGAGTHLKPLVDALIEAAARCAATRCGATIARAFPPSEDDWGTEYLDAIIAVRVVDGLDAAIAHIARYGSHHTDAIVTEDEAAAERFLAEVDSAIVLHNASTQFADGGEFGFGAEIGIATGKLHARGPVGVEQLTTFKYRCAAAARGTRASWSAIWKSASAPAPRRSCSRPWNRFCGAAASCGSWAPTALPACTGGTTGARSRPGCRWRCWTARALPRPRSPRRPPEPWRAGGWTRRKPPACRCAGPPPGCSCASATGRKAPPPSAARGRQFRILLPRAAREKDSQALEFGGGMAICWAGQ
jgi:hypothetical protein